MKQIELADTLNRFYFEKHPFFTIYSNEVNDDQHLLNGIIFEYSWLNLKIAEVKGILYINVDRNIFYNVLIKNKTVTKYLMKAPKNVIIADTEKLDVSKYLEVKYFFSHFGNIKEVLLDNTDEKNSSDQPIFYKIVDILTEINTLTTINLKNMNKTFIEWLYFRHFLSIKDSNRIRQIKECLILQKIQERTCESVLLTVAQWEKIQSYRSFDPPTWPYLWAIKVSLRPTEKEIMDDMKFHLILIKPLCFDDYFDDDYDFTQLSKETSQIILTVPLEEPKESIIKSLIPKHINEKVKEELEKVLVCPSSYETMDDSQIWKYAEWHFEGKLFPDYSQDEFWNYIYENVTKYIDKLYISLFDMPDYEQKPYIGKVYRLLIRDCSETANFQKIFSLFPRVRNLAIGYNKNESWDKLNAKWFSRLESMTLHLDSIEIHRESILKLDKCLPSRTKKYLLIQSENGQRVGHKVQLNSPWIRLGWQVLRQDHIFSFFKC